MEDEADRLDNWQDLSNLEAAFEILIEKKPNRIPELRQTITKAWLNGFITQEACKRLIGKAAQIQRP